MRKNVFRGVNFVIKANVLAGNCKLVTFASKHLEKIMYQFGLYRCDYAVGGSLAAFIYGVDYGRICHDIDVIVKPGEIEHIKSVVEDSPFMVAVSESSGAPEFGKMHFAFKTAENVIIDIIESSMVEEEKCHCYNLPFYIMTPKALIDSKQTYTRSKDFEDLAKLESVFNPTFNEERELQKDASTTISDMDALAALKEKMARGE